MQRIILCLALTICPLALHAQESTSAIQQPYGESYKDVIDRSKAAEAKLKELSAVVEMAVSCNEQGRLFKPVNGSAGTCVDVPMTTIYCSCQN
jgi:hypothetical protein